ncbi:hypothetical protein Pfo_031004 [Paulownia fortunei]|nr:hypothetical protein Pfo_031004 [Paulownia fortunei]
MKRWRSTTKINVQLADAIGDLTNTYGINVDRINIDELRPSVSIQEAMDKQLTADRERVATIAKAEAKAEADATKTRAEAERYRIDTVQAGLAARDDKYFQNQSINAFSTLAQSSANLVVVDGKEIDSLGINVTGNFWDMNFAIQKDGFEIGRVDQRWLAMSSTYDINIEDEQFETLVIALVVAIDYVKAQERASSASSAKTNKNRGVDMALQETMKALSNPVRREILIMLKTGAQPAGDIAQHFELSQATISSTFGIVETCGLGSRTKIFLPNKMQQVLHIEWAQWADQIFVVPATANLIGKIANGIADDAVTRQFGV